MEVFYKIVNLLQKTRQKRLPLQPLSHFPKKIRTQSEINQNTSFEYVSISWETRW